MTEIEVPTGVRARWLDDDRRPPMILEPEHDLGPDGLVGWLHANHAWVVETLPVVGAVLLRGFPIDDARAFEAVARAITPALKNDYVGTSPRDALTPYVFSASELPPHYPIPPHCEMSFVRAPPSHLFFWCDVPSSGPGGETPLTDVRRVWRDLDPAVRERFATRGVRNVRCYAGPEGGGRFDLWKLKPWHEMFRTSDRGRVEAACAEHGFEPTWLPGGRLRLVNTQPATARHPVTGEEAWFNHSQVFHLSAVPDEYDRIARRMGPLPWRGWGALSSLLVALKKATTAADDHAMHCTYGDHTPIADADMRAVREAFWRNMAFPKWERGDVVAIDNHAVAHGRMPYRGPRRIAVAWA